MKAIAYLRSAPGARIDQSSTDPQDSAIKSFYYWNDIMLSGIYEDIGDSGMSFDRQCWINMEECLPDKKSKIDFIIVTNLDKVGRSAPQVEERISFLDKEYGVKLLSIKTHPEIILEL